MSEHHEKTDNSFATLLTGIAIGAAITYMFTTKSGQKIKDELLKEGSKILGNIGDEIDKAKTDVEQKKDEIAKEISSSTEQITGQVQEIVKDTKEEISNLPQEVEKLQKKGRKFFFSKKSGSSQDS